MKKLLIKIIAIVVLAEMLAGPISVILHQPSIGPSIAWARGGKTDEPPKPPGA